MVKSESDMISIPRTGRSLRQRTGRSILYVGTTVSKSPNTSPPLDSRLAI